MKKIFLSLAMVLFVGSAVAGATGAFFSDTETSSGNTFAAGAIDLKVDNESYYNNNACVPDEAGPGHHWVGSNAYPVPGTPCDVTWTLTDLTVQKFFDFIDLKPGDTGEDTISLHIDNNDAYLCANVKLTSNNENGCNEPESLVDSSCGNPGPGQGELASNVNFIWWADDGDNVLESNEKVISQGPIGALGLNGSTTVTLADSATNIWTGTGGPAPGGKTQYIGKAWCFGTFGSTTLTALPQDGQGTTSPRTPANSTGGISCDGHLLNNSTQTDSLTADVTFNAVQARNNAGFLCTPVVRPTAHLTVTKVVVNNNGGNNIVSDFHLSVDDGFVSTSVTSGVSNLLPAGSYSVNEAGSTGYKATFSGDCDSEGNVTLANGDNKTCTITNTELPANITLIKVVTGTPPLDLATVFHLRVDGVLVPTGSSIAVTSNAPHAITEDARSGYSFVSITGDPKCPAILGGTATLDEGQAITCTITNHKN